MKKIPMTRYTALTAVEIALLAGAARALGQSNTCANATPLPGGATASGTTAGATGDGGCSCDADPGSPDVWYSYYATQTGTVTVDLCGSTFDTILSMHSACPGTSANEIACNDDSCGQQSFITATVAAGQTYCIRVAGYNGASGSFTIHVGGQTGGSGPDVVVSDIPGMTNWGALNGTTAYSFGTQACNIGNAPMSWTGNDNGHPVIAQNLYRMRNGRFVHIGQAWVKHGYASSNGSSCGACQIPPGFQNQLGVNCSDTYGADGNGGQGRLGPRSQINPTTGAYPWPFTAPPATTVIDRRLQVHTTDVTPELQSGAQYFVEASYISADEAQAGNGLNNASYRQVTIPSATATPILTGPVHQGSPAIQAWADNDPSVTLTTVSLPESGLVARYWVGGRASDNGNGTWHYEYAIFNLNSDRAVGAFSVPVPPGVLVSNFGFHAPYYHSGESYSNDVWSSIRTGGAASFSTADHSTDPNANAIRWGTLYNFRFDASSAPTTGSLTLGMFAPGSPGSLSVPGMPVPGAGGGGGPCYVNCDNSTTPPILNIMDFLCFQTRFVQGDLWANCDASTIPPILNVADFTCFMNKFIQGCP